MRWIHIKRDYLLLTFMSKGTYAKIALMCDLQSALSCICETFPNCQNRNERRRTKHEQYLKAAAHRQLALPCLSARGLLVLVCLPGSGSPCYKAALLRVLARSHREEIILFNILLVHQLVAHICAFNRAAAGIRPKCVTDCFQPNSRFRVLRDFGCLFCFTFTLNPSLTETCLYNHQPNGDRPIFVNTVILFEKAM